MFYQTKSRFHMELMDTKIRPKRNIYYQKERGLMSFYHRWDIWLRLLVLLNIFGYERLLLSLKVKKRDFFGCILYQKSEKTCPYHSLTIYFKIKDFWTASSSSFNSREDERTYGIHHHKSVVDSWNLSIIIFIHSFYYKSIIEKGRCNT